MMMKKSVKTEPLVYKWKHKHRIWSILQDTGLQCVFKPTKTRKEKEYWLKEELLTVKRRFWLYIWKNENELHGKRKMSFRV